MEESPSCDDDNWCIECSDEEKYYGDQLEESEREHYYEPSCDDIVQLYTRLVEGEELKLEWESPGRRLPSKIVTRKNVVNKLENIQIHPNSIEVEDEE